MGVLQEIRAVREGVAIWTRTSHTILQFRGRDAVSWLHGQTTNDIKGLRSGEGNVQALLDRQGRVLAFFTAHRWEDEVWLIVDRAQAGAVHQRMETHLILEDVQVADVGADAPQVLVEGPRALPFLTAASGLAPDAFPADEFSFAPLRLFDFEVLVFRMSESGEDGFLLIPAPGDADSVYDALLDAGLEFNLAEISETARRTLELEAGGPRYGMDVDASTLIAETPLERLAVSYDKGCYPGQEVVARLKAYGSPKTALCGLLMAESGPGFPPPGTALCTGGNKVGGLRRATLSPTLGQWIAFAYLDREHRVPGTVWTFDERDGFPAFSATVTTLPFYTAPTRGERARRLYEEALSVFESDPEDLDPAPIALLREAVVLDPAFEDAFETLGVILHRQGRVDEAIDAMRRLARLNPDSVMAHSNLSVFYMAKGMIAEAEAEKARAGQLEFKRQRDEQAAARQAEAERARIRAEALGRIGMFREVLEIDPEDPVATLGLGNAYMQLERYEEAIAPLEAATRAKKDFSAAYLNLGKCLEFAGRINEARAAYTAGIEAASRKGDLMPLREMERRLKGLAP